VGCLVLLKDGWKEILNPSEGGGGEKEEGKKL